jgi:hypothetical protein
MKPEETTAWNSTTEDDDVIRFVLRRKEWHRLITALAGSCTRNADAWDGLDVLRNAQIDVRASAMVKALTQIVKYAQVTKPDRNDMEIIRHTAERGLKDGAPEAKEIQEAVTA